jgi:hypothetical protein
MDAAALNPGAEGIDGIAHSYELILTSKKREGWRHYLAEIESFLRSPAATSDELKRIHLVMNHHAQAQVHGAIEEALYMDLYSLDRPDGLIKSEQFDRIRAKHALHIATVPEPALLSMLRFEFARFCSADAQVDLQVSFAGDLRRIGRRRIGVGEWHDVYASHTNFYGGPDLSVTPFPKTFFGVSVGLDALYASLGAKHDALRLDAQSGTLDDRLLVESHLQLIGTRVLHPFWDGNGRTFGGHLLLTLEREGIECRDSNVIDEPLMSTLNSMTEHYLEHTLERSGLEFIEGK